MGPWEIVLILVIVLIIFGVGKLPQVSSAIGKGLRAFRRGQSGEDEEEEAEKPRPEKKVVAKTTSKATSKKASKS